MSVLDELERDWKWMEFSLLYDDDPLMPKLIAVARAAQRVSDDITPSEQYGNVETVDVMRLGTDARALRAALAQLEGK